MSERYFVMLNHPGGYPAPIVQYSDPEDENSDTYTALWDSEAAARAYLKGNMFAEVWGYDIYPWNG